MLNLENQWNQHKEPLEEEREKLKQALNDRKLLLQKKVEEINQFRLEIDELNADLTSKENLAKDLNKELENMPKESKTSNRQFYTRRILEIVSNIDKQKKEIDKILIETKTLQKEINQLTGKLERIFNATDELLFKVKFFFKKNKSIFLINLNNLGC